MRTLDDLLVDAGIALDERSAAIHPSTAEHRDEPSGRRALLAVAAATVVVVSAAVAVIARDGDDAATIVPATSPASTTPGSTTAVSDDVAPTTVPASTAVPTTTIAPLTAPIAKGSSGDGVRRVEERLASLGFFVGDVDGAFDTTLQQAVWAWKKLVGNVPWRTFEQDPLKTTVTPEIWQQMLAPTEIAPRRPTRDGSTHVEIYLPLQVMAVFTADHPVFVAHISSGEVLDDGVTPSTFCEMITIDTDVNGEPVDPPVEKAICAETTTPGGVFRIGRRHDGVRIGPLGGMYRPQYFNYGIGVHGAENVPTHPASHGMVRVSRAAADELWSLLDRGDDVFVWGQDGREPEAYDRVETLPSFLYPAPDATVAPVAP